MKLTNKFNLPKTIVNAVERDPYSMGQARISVTGLLKPPRIGLLFKKHHSEIETDVTDHVWSLFGRAVHTILEQGGDEEHIPEERLFAEVRGWRISGQLDVQKLGDNKIKIIDYKTTSAYAVMAEKPEWEEQLNTYRWLVEQSKSYTVEALAICAFVRDWNRHKAAENPDYPQRPAVMLNVPLWSMEQATAFVEHRVKVHQDAQALWDMAGEAPHCTDAERWVRKKTYAVVKAGAKRATKVFDTDEEANGFVSKRAGYIVEVRGGEPVRCTGDYCNVSRWCSQYREWERTRDG